MAADGVDSLASFARDVVWYERVDLAEGIEAAKAALASIPPQLRQRAIDEIKAAEAQLAETDEAIRAAVRFIRSQDRKAGRGGDRFKLP